MIEASFDNKILRKALEERRVERPLAARLMQNHQSFEAALEFLKATDMRPVREIFLMHLSDRWSDAGDFKIQAMESTGRPVRICER